VDLPPRPSSDPSTSTTSTTTDPTEFSAGSTECPDLVLASRRGLAAHGDAATGSADSARGPAGRAGAAAEEEGDFVSRTKCQRRRDQKKLSKAYAQQRGRQTPSPEPIHDAAATGAADSAGPEGRAGAAAEEKSDLRTKCQRFREQKKLLKACAQQRGVDGPEKSRAEGVCDDAKNSTKISL